MPYFVYWREPVTKAQRSKAFKRLRDAEDFRDTVSVEIRQGTYADRRPVLFSTFAEDWLKRTKPTCWRRANPGCGASRYAARSWERCSRWIRKRQCPEGQRRWRLVEPKSKAGIRVVEIPGPLVPFLVAHREAQNGDPNPHGLVFPSEDGTPRYPGNVRRRVFTPALTGLGLKIIRPHEFRRTFVALHVEAGTHPKLLQERIAHSDIKTTMNVYGALAGKLQLGEEQAACLDSMATATAETLVNPWSTCDPNTPQNIVEHPIERKALSA